MKKNNVFMSIKNFHFNSLLFKNTLCIALAIMLPMGIIVFINHSDYRQEIYKQMMQSNESTLEKCATLGDSLLDDVTMAADELALSVDARQFMRQAKQYGAAYSSAPDYEDLCNRLIVQFMRYKQSFRYISHMFLYSSQTRVVLADIGLLAADHVDDQWIFFPRVANDGRSYYFTSDKYERMVHYRPVQSQQTEKTGFVIIEIDLRQLGEMISQNRSQNRSTLLMLDYGGRVIYKSDDPEDMADRDMIRRVIYTHGGGSRLETSSGLVFSAMETEHRCFYYGIVTQKHFFAEEEERYSHFLTLTIMLLVIGSLTAIVVITIYTYYPMRRIMDVIQHPYGSAADPVIEKKENELLYITSSIINVLEKNNQTSKELHLRIQAFNEAQARALQFQTNPHFLSNALEIIKWSSVSDSGFGNPTSIMLTKLAELYRNLIKDENVLIPLHEELDYVRLYMEILSYRYEDKITFAFDIQPQVEGYIVLKASVQPLIENAIKHGLRARQYVGTITVRAYTEGGSLYIEVKNDGEYTSNDAVERVNESLERDFTGSGTGIGLHNINARIKLIFGKKYGVRLHSNGVVGGVTAQIVLPMIEQTETE